MSVVPIFGTKSQFDLYIFFLFQFGLCFGKFDLNLIIYGSGTITTLDVVTRVSS